MILLFLSWLYWVLGSARKERTVLSIGFVIATLLYGDSVIRFVAYPHLLALREVGGMFVGFLPWFSSVLCEEVG